MSIGFFESQRPTHVSRMPLRGPRRRVATAAKGHWALPTLTAHATGIFGCDTHE
ncbi:hypothetical protein RKE25_04910 [Dyella sp. BiH032]|uniref:hypothetical protein n=1 Tax=Dyella sp. BiH032 TaxID=3075430 RepID=UPI00289353C7|nr:hypothetical protein [Dyella sp. BiH032]WNL46982.1 hypothetical protein RKE25_04910 [Dyella sp. BiH032]